jgi:hypothetical protein
MQPDTASKTRAAQRELPELPWLRHEPLAPRRQTMPSSPTPAQSPAPATKALRHGPASLLDFSSGGKSATKP